MAVRFDLHPWEPADWNRMIGGFPGAHILQTWEWSQVKAQTGWQPLFCSWEGAEEPPGAEGRPPKAAALVLERSAALPLVGVRMRVLYTPRGPLLDWGDADMRHQVLSDLAELARRRGAVFVKLDPQVALGTGLPGAAEERSNPIGQALVADLQSGGWCLSEEQIQFRNTLVIDLRRPLDQIMAGMKQKTRYNVRLAERKGVVVTTGAEADFDLLYRMYAETADRDDFVIRDEAYYRTAWSALLAAGMALPLIAEVDATPVAAIIVYSFAGRAWYMHGMSTHRARETMPNHLLQWEAIRRLKDAGCHTYDLWGAPDEFDESDPLWGVYRFKEGLGGELVQGLGAWDYPVRSQLYRVYTQVLPRLLDIMRRRGKQRTRRKVMG